MKKGWYSKKWITILIHATAWVLLFSLPYLLRPSYNPNDAKAAELQNSNFLFLVNRISDALCITFFYLNAEILIPRIFYRKKYAMYALTVLAYFAFFVTLLYFLRVNFTKVSHGFSFNLHLLFSTFIFIFILACSTAYKTIRDKVFADQLAKDKENEYLKTELALLRSQVSPHFMFNVLNNMVALARKKSDLLEPSLIKLSSLMRYMLYETDEEKVSLERETEYLHSYIDLQQQRFGKKVCVNINLQTPDKMYAIEPMLLIPFVENAFKHGTGMIQNAHIDICLKAEKNIINFSVANKYNPSSSEIKDKASGIGLVNVQRRLQLLYPSKHELHIGKENDLFKVSLIIITD